MISDAVVIAAIETVLKPLGSASLKHYMPGPKAAAIEAMRGVLQAQIDRDADKAHDWLRSWSSDLADTRDSYIEAKSSGFHAGRKMSPEAASGFAKDFRERAEAVFDCADGVAKAIRGEAA